MRGRGKPGHPVSERSWHTGNRRPVSRAIATPWYSKAPPHTHTSWCLWWPAWYLVEMLRMATLLAAIGNVLNFLDAAALKSYLGWASSVVQTGTTLNRAGLASAGTRATLYMVVMNAIRKDGKWQRHYERLVPTKCAYAAAVRRASGRSKNNHARPFPTDGVALTHLLVVSVVRQREVHDRLRDRLRRGAADNPRAPHALWRGVQSGLVNVESFLTDDHWEFCFSAPPPPRLTSRGRVRPQSPQLPPHQPPHPPTAAG
jgi:hypothetical protein